MTRHLAALAASACALAIAAPAMADPVLAPVWVDGAVIQRDMPVRVQGYAEPGAAISGTLGSARASANADADGVFVLEFPAREASGDPVVLSVSDETGSVRVGDIVTGDVYLCSGQSNMEFSVAAGLSGFGYAMRSTDPLLRMLHVPLTTAPVPTRDFGGDVAWDKAGPETTGKFSAACYFMMRDLRRDLDIPIGAIHSSWGGSQIRAWLSPDAGGKLYGADQMALLQGFAKDNLAAYGTFAETWQDWYSEASGGSTPWADPDSLEWTDVPAIAPWNTWGEGAPPAIGNVWFRRTIELTPEQAAAGGRLNIGIIDDLDATWVNGHPVGFNHGWSTERDYEIPARFLKAGANEVIFAASNSYDSGGMQSKAERLSFTPAGGTAIPLADGWRYSASSVTAMPPRAPWDGNAGIGVMHNRMVAPIGALSLAGAAWYQGESDVGIPGYDDRLRELFAGWRSQFGQDMRMLVVQLANYGTPVSEPGSSGWAEIREIEREVAVADRNAALVTAIDLGEWSDIHPTNKVLLGQRMALAARGEKLPMPVSAALQPGSSEVIAVTFDGVEDGLHGWSGHALAFELCGESQESCRYASGIATGNTVLLSTDGQPVTRVRHAWSDAPVVNVHDGRKIAIPGFEIPLTR